LPSMSASLHTSASAVEWVLAGYGLTLATFLGTAGRLAITPLTATVMSGVDPQRAGALSGVLSTMQQVGNALGVGVTGVIFFGALHGGFGPAFELSLAEIAGVLVVVAAMTRLLPRRESPATQSTI